MFIIIMINIMKMFIINKILQQYNDNAKTS